MKRKVKLRRLTLLGLITITVSTLAVGCVIQDPQALQDLNKANQAIAAAKQKGAADRFPDEFADLEKRYLAARGVFYACDENQASSLAMALVNDANALANKRMMAAPPANNPPKALFNSPVEVRINELVTFHAEDSSDPDGDKLNFQWDYGDGKMAAFKFPVATHRYTKVGSYTVRLTVDDGRGGTDSTSAVVLVSRLQVIQGDVLFDFDRFVIKPEGRQTLNRIITLLKENPSHRVRLTGFTDSIGTEAYNLKLSQRRAIVVRDYFVKNGIAANRITTKWMGEADPVASNKTREGRAKNRRTEILIRPGE